MWTAAQRSWRAAGTSRQPICAGEDALETLARENKRYPQNDPGEQILERGQERELGVKTGSDFHPTWSDQGQGDKALVRPRAAPYRLGPPGKACDTGEVHTRGQDWVHKWEACGSHTLLSHILHHSPVGTPAAAKSLQSCPTLCDPMDCSPPGFSIHGILQARTLKWVAISFSNAWKWKVKVKSLSRVWLLATPQTAAYRAPLSMGFSRQQWWSGVPLPSPPVGIAPFKNTCSQYRYRSPSTLLRNLTGKNKAPIFEVLKAKQNARHLMCLSALQVKDNVPSSHEVWRLYVTHTQTVTTLILKADSSHRCFWTGLFWGLSLLNLMQLRF